MCLVTSRCQGCAPVVEEEQVKLADVGDEELVEAAGQHVAGLLVRAYRADKTPPHNEIINH